MFIDTHAHLTYPTLNVQLSEVIERAEEAGVTRIINVATDLESAEMVLDSANKFDGVFAALGIHPQDSANLPSDWPDRLRELLSKPKVVALGEIGLDYYREFSPKATQIEVFRRQILIARELKLPMILHDRQAHEDLKQILTEIGYHKGVLHCFSGNAVFAREMTDLGFYISFTGNATYGNRKTEQAAQAVPLEKLMLETDAPFLAPEGKRGETNEPAYIPLIAAKIAELKGLPIETVATVTTQNAINFFNLP
ncbi:MAG: TatD family hydrolase [Candidatus Marinimicrobia bacterium]|jgi:TatD DNase family protein|nr:TatD family hydrolase [Candidatus Neomarinimicrobiota bacterium]MCK9558931.1 TatD family hydrolase [Candidatus Neomarinimicrobiota bacterium]